MNNYFPFINLPLSYEYDALEPYIDEKTMRLHHDKHLQSYIDKLNETLNENPRYQKLSLTQLIKSVNRLPQNLQKPIRNYAGGVYNHRLYFDMFSPEPKEIKGRLITAINIQFESFYNFKNELMNSAVSLFGSGYTWLVLDRGILKIVNYPNQNCPLENNLCPILLIDVWEHAYYLKHYNVRGSYFEDWFNLIDWEKAEQNYINCMKNA